GIWMSESCQIRPGDAIAKKNLCYQEKLDKIKNGSIYKEVFSQFKDTLHLLICQSGVFGVAGYSENKPDDAIFFNKDSTKCLLLILQKTKRNDLFGNARIVGGSRYGQKWLFRIGLQFSFEKGYYEIYKNNDFGNISKIARYNVMTSGN